MWVKLDLAKSWRVRYTIKSCSKRWAPHEVTVPDEAAHHGQEVMLYAVHEAAQLAHSFS